jgi:Ni/Fe-hydrogenase subunit HybB-like protein
MGRPDRLWFVLRYGRLQSPILWDVVSVTLYFLGSVTYLYLPLIPDVAIIRDNTPPTAPGWQKRLYSFLALGWRGNKEQWLRLEKAIAIMAVIIIPVAVSVHTIISWILATTVQPGWHSSIFGPYFVVGAIFSGIGALFLAMSAVRRALGLEEYITLRQYRNLGLLFIVMNLIWFYFTYAEHLGIAAAQQIDEFVVLASKLWGPFAAGFWIMIALMVASFWVLVIPKLLGAIPRSRRVARPEVSLVSGAGAVVTFLMLVSPPLSWLEPLYATASLSDPVSRTAAWALLILFSIGVGVGVAPWLEEHPVASAVIASVFVVLGMWLERWNIIVPTMTHPRLIPFSNYLPTATELSLTAASVALFLLLFLLFFKLFPAVSLWEVAEGRVVEEARSQVSIPEPEPSQEKRGLRWVQRKLE